MENLVKSTAEKAQISQWNAHAECRIKGIEVTAWGGGLLGVMYWSAGVLTRTAHHQLVHAKSLCIESSALTTVCMTSPYRRSTALTSSPSYFTHQIAWWWDSRRSSAFD